MSWRDRDYMREDAGGDGSGGGFGMRRPGSHSMVTWLIIINAVLFMWDAIFGGSLRASALEIKPHAYFSVDTAVHHYQVWRFFTYQFVHVDFLHILINMVMLYFFGPIMERWWGSKRFLVFYLLCGVSGAIVATLLGAIPGMRVLPSFVPVLGASGSIFGILIAAAVLFPQQQVRLLFPPITMTMRTMALAFLVIAVVSVLAGSSNAGGEAAHLGGAALGYLLVRRPRLLDWADRFSPSAIQSGINKNRWQKKQQDERALEVEVDRILAKVRDQGLGSLTRKEKKTLKEATERQKMAG
ncbi:MAG: rhomboid family intramembrane serine protease [Phycisphaeraceae bacterium]|nr:rhomboid family intramembrane serine protease [Phycisphaeraceae bacterium]